MPATTPILAPTAPATLPLSSRMREIFLWYIRREKRINKGKGERGRCFRRMSGKCR